MGERDYLKRRKVAKMLDDLEQKQKPKATPPLDGEAGKLVKIDKNTYKILRHGNKPI